MTTLSATDDTIAELHHRLSCATEYEKEKIHAGYVPYPQGFTEKKMYFLVTQKTAHYINRLDGQISSLLPPLVVQQAIEQEKRGVDPKVVQTTFVGFGFDTFANFFTDGFMTPAGARKLPDVPLTKKRSHESESD
jgi:hypothetical protein